MLAPAVNLDDSLRGADDVSDDGVVVIESDDYDYYFDLDRALTEVFQPLW